MRISLISAIVLLLISSCRKGYTGENLPNQAPETGMAADTVLRFEDNRYKSVIEVEWWGSDADGFVQAFEVSLDGTSWTRTFSQDSTLTLTLPNNSDTANFQFYVRAIDNEGLRDPSPASLVYPVKNSAPTVEFIIGERSPVRTFPALKYFWKGADPDGNASIDHYELTWNDSTNSPFEISASFSEAGFLGKNLSGITTDCDVYPGSLNNPLNQAISGLLLDAENTLFIRAVDAVGATSTWVASPTVFIKKPSSDILFINAQQSAFNRANTQQFYSDKLVNTLGKGFDTLQAGPDNASKTELSVDPITQDRVFSYFKKIFIYSENSEYVLSLMQRSSGNFFSNGGKLFLITEGNDVIEDQPAYLDFSPIARYTARPQNVSLLMNLNDSVYSSIPNYPSLLNSATILSGIRPFETPGSNANFTFRNLYDAVITQDSSGSISIWKGNSTLIAARTRVQSGEVDFVLSMIPIHKLENNAHLDDWFAKMLIDELNF